MVMLAGQGSNLQPPDPKSGVLPLNYRPLLAVELRVLTLAVKKPQSVALTIGAVRRWDVLTLAVERVLR